MSRAKATLTTSFVMTLLASASYAQDTAGGAEDADAVVLDTLVIESANRTETPVSETTVSVSVVPEEEIEKQRSVNTTVGDILSKTVPGFGQSTENLTEYGQSMRGRNFLTLIDGVPQTNTLNNNFRALNSIGTSAIGQVEVVRGATAAYGFGAPGGLVNIITKRPVEDGTNYEFETGIRFQPSEAGESLAYTGHLTASGRDGNFDYLLDGSYESTSSSFSAAGERRPPDSFGTQGGLDDVDAFNILAKGGYELAEHRIELTVNHYNYRQDSNWAGVVGGGSISGGTSATPSWGNLNTEVPGIENTTISGKYTNSDVFGGSMDLQLFYNDNTTTFTRTEFLGFQYPQYETASQKYGARMTFDTPFYVAGQDLDLVWGLDYIHDKTVVNDIDGPSGTPDAMLQGIAPFAQINADIGDRARLTAGLRYEFLEVEIPDFTNANGFAVSGGTVSYDEPLFNISGAYDLTDMVTVFGGFSQGFQLGNLVRYVTDNNVPSVSDLSGRGQKTNSYEAGLRFDSYNWNLSATGFYNESDNGESYTSGLDLVLAPEEIYGIEFAGEYDFGNGVVIGGTATWMEGRYDTDGDGELDSDLGSDRIQPAKITAFAELTPNDWSSYRVQGLYSGSRNADSTQFLGLQDIESYFLVDAFADFEVGKGTFSVGVENVFNEDYAPVIQQAYSVEAYGYDDYYYVKGPGRTVSMSYKIKF